MLPWWKIMSCFVVILLESCVVYLFKLGIHDQFMIAGIRAYIQLALLGLILKPIFAFGALHWEVVLVYIFCFMVIVAAQEASARPKMIYPWIWTNCFVSIAFSLCLMITILMLVVMPTPWYNPQYLIPMAGMLINNSLTGIAPALNMLVEHLNNRKDHVLILLSYGASKWEATWPLFSVTFRQALIPAINGLNVIGLVSIPGMMTGQIIGGSDPQTAANYQIVISILISGCQTLSVISICMLTVRSLFDKRGRLVSERFRKNNRMNLAQLFLKSTWVGCFKFFCRCCFKKEGPLDDKLNEDMFLSTTPLELRLESTPRDVSSKQVIFELELASTIAARRPVCASLQLRAGEIACILGPSGIGKSTILKFASDLAYPGEKSSMKLRGKSFLEYDEKQWRREVLYVHQGSTKLPGTPREFAEAVQHLKTRSGQKTLEVSPFLEALGLTEPFLDKNWDKLSGGEAQRAMCAIALSTRPSVILFDEPTSALDDAGKKHFENLVHNLDWECCMLFVSHDEAQVARVANSVWRLTEK